MDLCNAIGIRFGIDLPATAAFDYPTAAALADLVSAGTAPTQAWHKALAVMPTGVKAVYDIIYQHLDLPMLCLNSLHLSCSKLRTASLLSPIRGT